ncbi:EF-hand calcium-binding domain-containing protein 8 isoform X1 [Equus przewalskii]|uniref:WD repeat-containing protein on Y chromosome n=3 Tax=Equus przewalskii TaxID=9798 RepID=A0ABM4LUI9_EQUPR
MSQSRCQLKTSMPLSSIASRSNWGEQIGSGSKPVSSKSPQPQKASIPGGFQKSKEVPSFPASSITLSQMPDFQQESQLFTELHLAKVEKMFEDDVNSTGALDKKAFIKAMKKMVSGVSDEMLEALFLKVDTDCSGFVTWPKYVDYMIREFRGKEMMKSQYRLHFQLPMRIIPLNHGSEIVKVEFLIHRFKKTGYFLTITKDGFLQSWSESFVLINCFRLNKIQQLHNQRMWVIDMVCLHNMNLVAVASTDQRIEFFDISNHSCVPAFTFIDLDSCVLVMDYWSDYSRGVFCYGDTKGNVFVFTSDNVTNGLFNPQIFPKASKWDQGIKVSTQKLLNEKSPLHRSYRLKALHPNWCQQVKFIPQLNLVASCSAIEKSSLVLTILPSKAPENPKFSVLNLRRGILCFDYCPDKNFLVTGGYDPLIRLWNPFFSKKPVWLMKGHQTSVTHILVNSQNSSILLSVSKDKNIRVWDMQDYICLQSFCGKLFALGNCPITSAYFHKNDNTLICSTYSIGILKGYLETQGPGKAGEKITTHSTPLCNVLYSKLFKQVVSGSLSGIVSVWEMVTGRRMLEFSVTGDEDVELTAMSLDESERCLLTGLQDGTVKMWNHSIGECLLTFPSQDQLEISGIVHMNNVFYVTGWSKRITCFRFHKAKPVLLSYHWQTFHKEDVLSMAKYQNQFLGTSSYNGDILFWNVSMFRPIFNFNASESPLPLTPKRVRAADDFLGQMHCPSKSCLRLTWAHRSSEQPQDSSEKTVANANLRRTLTSAPPVMRQSRDKDPGRPVPLQKPLNTGSPKPSRMPRGTQSLLTEAEKRKGELMKKISLQSNASVEKIIFLQTRPRLPHTAALLSSCADGCIYAWSIHGNGGLLGKFPVDLEDKWDVVVGAMATDENDCILVTGDNKGHIKIWDIKDYCTPTDKRSSQHSGVNKFQFLIPKRIRTSLPYYVPLKEKEVVAGQTISLVPPKLLITWKGHLGSVADILYVDSFQLVISAGQDRDVKAWKLTGDAIGTFGLSVWKRLQDTQVAGDHELTKTFKEEAASMAAAQKSYSELREERDLAEALVHQRREQAALLALLSGKLDSEAEAWARLQKIMLTSPWAGGRSSEDIENSWREWESQGKQGSRVVGAAYKPRERSRSPGLLSTNVPYGWMKYQISAQVYQSLHFSELAPTDQTDFMMHKVPGQQGWLTYLATDDIQKDLDPYRETMTNTITSMSTAIPSRSSLASSASGSGTLVSSLSSYPWVQPSPTLLRPWSAATAQSSPTALSQASGFTLQRSATPIPVASSLKQHSRPEKATLLSSMKKGSHVRF